MYIKIMYNINPFKNVFQYQIAKFNSAKPWFFSIKLIKQFLLIQGKRNGVLVLFNLQLLKYCWWWTYFFTHVLAICITFGIAYSYSLLIFL